MTDQHRTSDSVSHRGAWPKCKCESCCADAVAKSAQAYGKHLHKRGGSIAIKVRLSGKKKS